MNGKKTVAAILAAVCAGAVCANPKPRAALADRMRSGPEIIGIVHWGLNTYTDREWGYGDEDPAMLAPSAFDAFQITEACKAGGIGGLVVVAKHHDGFCLWPTKTTGHNISKSPFRNGNGDYVREMSDACRRSGIRFGVYCSPWDRNNGDYGTAKYVETYHAQIRELLSGAYGEVFEMWFDGANGGDGYYAGARERRRIGPGYYRFPEVFGFVRELQPTVTIFAGESDGSDFRWPGNEKGELDPDSCATIETVGGYANGKYGNPNYRGMINTGCRTGDFFRVCEADFPLRKGWFYHESQRGTTKSAAYLMRCYLRTVGHGGTMNIGVSPDRRGLLDDDDVRALKGFSDLRKAFFSNKVASGPANVVMLREDITNGEQITGWSVSSEGKVVAKGTIVGNRRIRVTDEPFDAAKARLDVSGGKPASVEYYRVDPELVKLVMTSTTDSGETDTAKWMTGAAKEKR